MVKTKLVDGLLSDGAKLLNELDRQNFPVESMFWIHLPDEDYWRLVIASPEVTRRGSAAEYRHLNGLLGEIELAGITLEDISLLDPDSSQFRSLRSLASGSSRLAAGSEWVEMEDAIVYRWNGASASAELSCELSLIELKQLWEAERRLSNLPALLIRADNGRVTLRFHPQHGHRDGIADVKTQFQIALHRKHPDCRITWLAKL
jgi:hypothetical protein